MAAHQPEGVARGENGVGARRDTPHQQPLVGRHQHRHHEEIRQSDHHQDSRLDRKRRPGRHCYAAEKPQQHLQSRRPAQQHIEHQAMKQVNYAGQKGRK